MITNTEGFKTKKPKKAGPLFPSFKITLCREYLVLHKLSRGFAD